MVTYTNRGWAVNHPHELPPQRYIDSEAEVQLHQYTVSCDQTFIQLKKECGMNGDQCTHTIMFSFFKKTHVWTDLKLHTVQPAIFMSHFRSFFSNVLMICWKATSWIYQNVLWIRTGLHNSVVVLIHERGSMFCTFFF